MRDVEDPHAVAGFVPARMCCDEEERRAVRRDGVERPRAAQTFSSARPQRLRVQDGEVGDPDVARPRAVGREDEPLPSPESPPVVPS